MTDEALNTESTVVTDQPITETTTESSYSGQETIKATIPETPTSKAFKQAQEILAARKSEQAPESGASTLETSAEAPANTEEATRVAPTVASNAKEEQDSTEIIPLHNWSEQDREDFKSLTEPKSKVIVTRLFKNMQSGLTQAMQAISAKERQVENLITLSEHFNKDPQGVLEHLAKQAGIELFRKETEEEVPVLESVSDVANWAAKKATKELETKLSRERQATQQAIELDRAKNAFLSELRDAEIKYPDLPTYKDGILQALSKAPNLSVEEAYRLATYDNALKLATEAASLKQELATLKAENLALKASKTRPNNSIPNLEQKPISNKTQSPTEVAYQRAQRKLAARTNH